MTLEARRQGSKSRTSSNARDRKSAKSLFSGWTPFCIQQCRQHNEKHKQSHRPACPPQQRVTLTFWPFDLRINACRVTVVYCMTLIAQIVFLLEHGQTHVYTLTHRQKHKDMRVQWTTWNLFSHHWRDVAMTINFWLNRRNWRISTSSVALKTRKLTGKSPFQL